MSGSLHPDFIKYPRQVNLTTLPLTLVAHLRLAIASPPKNTNQKNKELKNKKQRGISHPKKRPPQSRQSFPPNRSPACPGNSFSFPIRYSSTPCERRPSDKRSNGSSWVRRHVTKRQLKALEKKTSDQEKPHGCQSQV